MGACFNCNNKISTEKIFQSYNKRRNLSYNNSHSINMNYSNSFNKKQLNEKKANNIDIVNFGKKYKLLKKKELCESLKKAEIAGYDNSNKNYLLKGHQRSNYVKNKDENKRPTILNKKENNPYKILPPIKNNYNNNYKQLTKNSNINNNNDNMRGSNNTLLSNKKTKISIRSTNSSSEINKKGNNVFNSNLDNYVNGSNPKIPRSQRSDDKNENLKKTIVKIEA